MSSKFFVLRDKVSSKPCNTFTSAFKIKDRDYNVSLFNWHMPTKYLDISMLKEILYCIFIIEYFLLQCNYDDYNSSLIRVFNHSYVAHINVRKIVRGIKIRSCLHKWRINLKICNCNFLNVNILQTPLLFKERTSPVLIANNGI